MTACIYCGAPATSREHWLPRGLGAIRGLTPLQDRLCDGCNQALGQLDEELLRTGPTAFFRAALGIRGRAGHVEVSPFHYRAMYGEPPTTMMMPAHHGEYKILAEVYPSEAGQTRPLRQVVFKRPGGGIECVPFPPAWSGEQMKAAVRERHLEDAELLEIYLGEDGNPDSMEVRRVLTDALGKFSARAWYGKGDSAVKPVTVKAGITTAYLRAVAKVAFHYFLWVSTTCRGDEPEFQALRRFMRQGEGNSRAFVSLITPVFIPELRQGQVPPQPSHFFFAEQNYREVFARVQFFVGPDLPPPSLVRLGRSPSRIDARWLSAHWVRYYPQKTGGYDGEIETVDVTPRRIILPG